MRQLKLLSIGPGVTVQDSGRAGYLAFGLSKGGVADTLALAEGAALLQQSLNLAVLEMALVGGEFEAQCDLRIALTGAPMAASINGQEIAWQSSHMLSKGSRLSIGVVKAGCYGYLHIGGGINTPEVLGARGTHLAAAIGPVLKAGQCLEIGEDASFAQSHKTLKVDSRWQGGELRVLPSLQTHWFDKQTIDRFENTVFTRDARGNRMGVRLVPDGEGFQSEAGLSVLSEVIVSGDIQVTGDGTPFVLLCECGTTGGYPRIGSVLPLDLPLIAQTPVGSEICFRFVELDEALALQAEDTKRRAALTVQCEPLVRDPASVNDLLAYQLISGVVDSGS